MELKKFWCFIFNVFNKLSTILFDYLCIFSIFMDRKNVGVNQVIALKEEPVGYSYVKVQVIDTMFNYLWVACKFAGYELWNIITFAQQHAC